MGEVFSRYRTVVLPTKAVRTQKSDGYSLRRLQPIFSHMPPDAIEPHHVWHYWEQERGRSRQGRLEVGVLSHCFTMAMRWGLAKRNPCVGLRFPRNKARDRYVTDEEFEEARKRAPDRVQLAMDLALITGLRLTDILALRPESLSDEGLIVKTSKTGKALCFTWTDELHAAAQAWVALPPMTESGFTTAWQRLMRPVAKELRWQFRDLRAKSATDTEDEKTASRRLGHTSLAITRKVYIRKPTRVDPLDRQLDN
jgi:integrase